MTQDNFVIKVARRDVAAARGRGDRLGEAQALSELAAVLTGPNRSSEARLVLSQLKSIGEELIGPAEQAVADARHQGDLRAEVYALAKLSKVLRYAGRYGQAERVLAQFSQRNHEQFVLDNRKDAERARETNGLALSDHPGF